MPEGALAIGPLQRIPGEPIVRVEAHPSAAALDPFVVDRVEAVDHPVSGAGSKHGVEGGNDLRSGRPIAIGKASKQHRFAAAEEMPRIHSIDPRATGEHADEQRGVSILGQAPYHVVTRPPGRLERSRKCRNARFQPSTFIMPGQESLGRRLKMLIGVSIQPVAERSGDGMHDRNRVFRLQIVELDAEPAEPVAAPAAGKGQAHCRFGNRGVLIPNERRNGGVGSSVHPRGELLFVGPAEQ